MIFDYGFVNSYLLLILCNLCLDLVLMNMDVAWDFGRLLRNLNILHHNYFFGNL